MSEPVAGSEVVVINGGPFIPSGFPDGGIFSDRNVTVTGTLDADTVETEWKLSSKTIYGLVFKEISELKPSGANVKVLFS